MWDKSEQRILKIGNISDWEVTKEMYNIPCNEGNPNQDHNDSSPTGIRMAKIS